MLTITQSQVFVSDQDEAIGFYVDILGFEIHDDVDLGFMRWLTVRAAGDPSRRILLERPGPPAMDAATADVVTDVLTRGAAGGWLALETDDVHATYQRLVAAGVDVTDEPSEKPYGVDFGIRDPFGNRIRIGTVRA